MIACCVYPQFEFTLGSTRLQLIFAICSFLSSLELKMISLYNQLCIFHWNKSNGKKDRNCFLVHLGLCAKTLLFKCGCTKPEKGENEKVGGTNRFQAIVPLTIDHIDNTLGRCSGGGEISPMPPKLKQINSMPAKLFLLILSEIVEDWGGSVIKFSFKI